MVSIYEFDLVSNFLFLHTIVDIIYIEIEFITVDRWYEDKKTKKKKKRKTKTWILDKKKTTLVLEKWDDEEFKFDDRVKLKEVEVICAPGCNWFSNRNQENA